MDRPKRNDNLVSIIVPVHNAERFVDEAIKSVLVQTYSDWELILVDDGSTDKSADAIIKYKSNKVKIVSLAKNVGAAKARNRGIGEARGRYLCFLDADDLWTPEKLEKQVRFMREKDCAFSFTGYEFADGNGQPNGKAVHVPSVITYRQALRNTTISTITVMLDMDKLSKEDIMMPSIASEDTATWWNILKKVKCAYGLNEILSYYRRNSGTLSANKIVSAKRTWNLYRKHEGFGLMRSFMNFMGYAFSAVKRRI